MKNKTIKSMEGKEYIYKDALHLIQHITEKNEKFYVVTNKDFYEFETTSERLDFLAHFIPTPEREPTTSVAPIDENGITRPNSRSGNLMAYLKGVLVEDIEKVRENKDYVEQAKTASNNIKRLIDIAKLEIQIKNINQPQK